MRATAPAAAVGHRWLRAQTWCFAKAASSSHQIGCGAFRGYATLGPGASAAGDSSSLATTLKFSIGDSVAELGRRSGPLALYENLVEGGQLQRDEHQQRVMEMLNAIYHGAPLRQAKGLYLYGSVGCGKTLAMDLFFSSMCDSGLRVERKHFHEFLNEVQLLLHRMKHEEGGDGTPVRRVANRIADRIDVLCFDEFAITTIQDCVLLMPLFSGLFERGVTIVATSNRAPDDLYTDGLNRHLYLPPFLGSLRMHCKIHHLQSSTDYRRVHHTNSPDAGVFCWPPDPDFMDRWFEAIAGGGSSGSLEVSYSRELKVPALSSCKRVARFSFDDLCRCHLSADDYMWLCRQVHTILVDDVPRLSVDDHNEARRFTLLIDNCYERHVRLICSMAGPPEELLGGLSELRRMNLRTLGQSQAGCGDGDTSPSSSGVLQAISRIKESMAERAEQERKEAASGSGPMAHVHPRKSTLDLDSTIEVLSAEIDRVHSHGDKDIDVWRQGGDSNDTTSGHAPPQVSKAWDDRRRISQFSWESADPTAEQQTIKGVFTAAVASLQESGFAVDRAISRLKEMQTRAFQEHHRLKHSLA